MSEKMIEILGLSRRFGQTQALDNINLEVNRGEVMGFLGPNGAGKTTAMRILSGLLSPSSGHVRVAGMDILNEPIKVRQSIGFLPETPPIYGEMTVREYLTYLASLRGVGKGALKQSVNDAMDRCGLTAVSHRLLRNLSKGYRQRAGIAQAIVHKPDIVILDEPTVGLDPIQIREIRKLIRELGGEHSVLLSTHILPEVQMTCDRVSVINNGRIVAQDTLAGLEARQKAAKGLRFVWDNPPDDATLQSIPGVAELQTDGDAKLIIPNKNQDPRAELVKRSVENNWGLLELRPVEHSLEEIFVQLTTMEPQGNNTEVSQ
ncbi:MAG: ABC transporter ATP-binding protein [Magnetococcales bacterium]|nr:ABC transporter ATP-binding protein [Magnetococcales bacterium]